MAIYNSVQKTYPFGPVPTIGEGGTVRVARGKFTVSTQTLTSADTINMLDLPQNARIVGATLKADKVDSSNTLRLNVGISGNTTLLFTGSGVGSGATSFTSAVNASGMDYLTTARKTTVQIVPSANAAGASAGDIVLMVQYVVEQPA